MMVSRGIIPLFTDCLHLLIQMLLHRPCCTLFSLFEMLLNNSVFTKCSTSFSHKSLLFNPAAYDPAAPVGKCGARRIQVDLWQL